MNRIALGLAYIGLFLIVTINSQFIEISHDSIRTGDDVTLKCRLGKNQDLDDVSNYVWYFNNKKVINDENFAQNGYELKIQNAKRHLSGYYSCVIEFPQSGAKLETPHELINIDSPMSPPDPAREALDSNCSFRIPKLCRNKRNKEDAAASFKFTPKPTSKNLEIGTTNKIHCKAAGSTKIYWIKEAEDFLPENVEDNNGTLIFENVAANHRGKYTCIASNDDKEIKTSIDVGLLPKFEIKPPAFLEVVEYQPVFLDCVGSGSPAPTVRWDFENKLISNDGEDSRFKIFENGSLVLQEARQEDDGQYGCTIGNSAGFKREQTVLLVKSMDSHSSFEDTEKEDGFMMSKAVIMTCLVAFIYIALVVALMLWCRHKRQKSRDSNDPENKEENDDTASDGDEKEPLNHETRSSRNNKVHQHSEKQNKLTTSPSSTLIIDHLMVRRDQLIDKFKLGRGYFGEILIAELLELPSSLSSHNNHQNPKENGGDVNEIQVQNRVQVLVKSMSKIKGDQYFVEFRRQIDVFRAVDSPNVVKLLALCFEKDHHFMVLEHAEELKCYLEKNAEISIQKLLNFCLQIAHGLDAISKSKLTHRDISLRNCIITKTSTIKISSIALCKDKQAQEYVKINNKITPLRNLAPEVLDSFTYSTASDVYAVGVTFWEILKQGSSIPYEEISNDEFLQKLQLKSLDLTSLAEDDKIPEGFRKTLLTCWSTHQERPGPEDLIKSIDELLLSLNGDNA